MEEKKQHTGIYYIHLSSWEEKKKKKAERTFKMSNKENWFLINKIIIMHNHLINFMSHTYDKETQFK